MTPLIQPSPERQRRPSSPIRPPIQRIFEEIMGRQMTPQEKKYFCIRERKTKNRLKA
jgi:hypothetical protein